MKAKMIFEAAQELRKIGNILNYLIQIDDLKKQIEERRRKNEIL